MYNLTSETGKGCYVMSKCTTCVIFTCFIISCSVSKEQDTA